MNYREGIIKETEFFTTAELAKKLKMNVQVITRKVQSGEISAYKIGKEWRIPEPAVYEWLEARGNGRRKSRPVLVKSERPDSDPATAETTRFTRTYLLEYILAQFEPGRDYSEDEVNGVIQRYFDDATTLRRELIAAGMMDRNNGRYRRRAGYRFAV
ncbi:MAG: DUF2087 domain-containing protein [Candidatus Zixiibacteriota bacterium]|nr:MAG: DUF2087 domain-containing protein [candidate division Zixibacteria bacterium]